MVGPSDKNAPSERLLPCWISYFEESAKHKKSPAIFMRWAGIGAISSVLRRNVWVRLQQEPIFPNLYIVLVAGPGIGKGRAIRSAKELVLNTPTFVAPTMATPEVFLEKLGRHATDDKRPGWMTTETIQSKDGLVPYSTSTVSVLSEEFSNFLHENDNIFMDALTELYDTPRKFDKLTKTSGQDFLENCCITILAGTTPDTLRRILPEAAFKQGFASRLNLIFSSDNTLKPLFGGEPEIAAEAQRLLTHDLQIIAQLRGEISFEPEVAEQFNDWYMKGMQPRPLHPRLLTYNERRHIHLAKLMTISSVSRGNSMVISMDDLKTATRWLLESEIAMPEALSAMGEVAEVFQYQDAVSFVKARYEKTAKPVPEMDLRAYLLFRVPAQHIRAAIEEMLHANWLVAYGDKPGARAFVPGSRSVGA